MSLVGKNLLLPWSSGDRQYLLVSWTGDCVILAGSQADVVMSQDEAVRVAGALVEAVRKLRGLPVLTDEERLDFAIGNLEAK